MQILWPSLIFYVIDMINNLVLYKFSKFSNVLWKCGFLSLFLCCSSFCHPLINSVPCIIFSCAVFCDVWTTQIGLFLVVPFNLTFIPIQLCFVKHTWNFSYDFSWNFNCLYKDTIFVWPRFLLVFFLKSFI